MKSTSPDSSAQMRALWLSVDFSGSMGCVASILRKLIVALKGLSNLESNVELRIVVHHGWHQEIRIVNLTKTPMEELNQTVRISGGSGIEPSFLAAAFVHSLMEAGDYVFIIGDMPTRQCNAANNNVKDVRFERYVAGRILQGEFPDGLGREEWGILNKGFDSLDETVDVPPQEILQNAILKVFNSNPRNQLKPIVGENPSVEYSSDFDDVLPAVLKILNVDVRPIISSPMANINEILEFVQLAMHGYGPEVLMDIPFAGLMWRALLSCRRNADSDTAGEIQELLNEVSRHASDNARVREWLDDSLLDREKAADTLRKAFQIADGTENSIRCWRFTGTPYGILKDLMSLKDVKEVAATLRSLEVETSNATLQEALEAEGERFWIPCSLPSKETMDLLLCAAGTPSVFERPSSPQMWMALIMSCFPAGDCVGIAEKAIHFLKENKQTWASDRNWELFHKMDVVNFAYHLNEYFPEDVRDFVDRMYWTNRYLTVLGMQFSIEIPEVPVLQEHLEKSPVTGDVSIQYIGPAAPEARMLPCAKCGHQRHMSNVIPWLKIHFDHDEDTGRVALEMETSTSCGICFAAITEETALPFSREPSPFPNEKLCKCCGMIYAAETKDCKTRFGKCYFCRNDHPLPASFKCSKCTITYQCPTAPAEDTNRTWTCHECLSNTKGTRSVEIQIKKVAGPRLFRALTRKIDRLGRAYQLVKRDPENTIGSAQDPIYSPLYYMDEDSGIELPVLNWRKLVDFVNQEGLHGILTTDCGICCREVYKAQLTSLCGKCQANMCAKCSRACVSSLVSGSVVLPSACHCPFCRAPNRTGAYALLQRNRPRAIPAVFDPGYWYSMCSKCNRVCQSHSKDCMRDEEPPQETNFVCDDCKEVEVGAPVMCPDPECRCRFVWAEACAHLQCPECQTHFCGMCSLLGVMQAFDTGDEVYNHMSNASGDSLHCGECWPRTESLEKYLVPIQDLGEWTEKGVSIPGI